MQIPDNIAEPLKPKPPVGALRRTLQIATLIAGLAMFALTCQLPTSEIMGRFAIEPAFQHAGTQLFVIPTIFSFLAPGIMLIVAAIVMFARGCWGYWLAKGGVIMAALAVVVEVLRTADFLADMQQFLKHFPQFGVGCAVVLLVALGVLLLLRTPASARRRKPQIFLACLLILLQVLLIFGWHRVVGYIMLHQSLEKGFSATLNGPVTYKPEWTEKEFEVCYFEKYVITVPKGRFTFQGNTESSYASVSMKEIDKSGVQLSLGLSQYKVPDQEREEFFYSIAGIRRLFGTKPSDFSLLMSRNDLYRFLITLREKASLVDAYSDDNSFTEFHTDLLEGVHGSLGKSIYGGCWGYVTNGDWIIMILEMGDKSEQNRKTVHSLFASIALNPNPKAGAEYDYAMYKKLIADAGDDKDKIKTAASWLDLAISCDRRKEWEFEKADLMFKTDTGVSNSIEIEWHTLKREYPDDERIASLKKRIDDLREEQRKQWEAKRQQPAPAKP